MRGGEVPGTKNKSWLDPGLLRRDNPPPPPSEARGSGARKSFLHPRRFQSRFELRVRVWCNKRRHEIAILNHPSPQTVCVDIQKRDGGRWVRAAGAAPPGAGTMAEARTGQPPMPGAGAPAEGIPVGGIRPSAVAWLGTPPKT